MTHNIYEHDGIWEAESTMSDNNHAEEDRLYRSVTAPPM